MHKTTHNFGKIGKAGSFPKVKLFARVFLDPSRNLPQLLQRILKKCVEGRVVAAEVEAEAEVPGSGTF